MTHKACDAVKDVGPVRATCERKDSHKTHRGLAKLFRKEHPCGWQATDADVYLEWPSE